MQLQLGSFSISDLMISVPIQCAVQWSKPSKNVDHMDEDPWTHDPSMPSDNRQHCDYLNLTSSPCFVTLKIQNRLVHDN